MSTPDATGFVEIVQTLSWAGAVVTAAIAVAGFFFTQAESRRQRRQEINQRRLANKAAEQELEWRRAKAAWVGIEKLEADRLAYDAMLMLDWDDRLFPSRLDAPRRWRLSQPKLLMALRTEGKGLGKERFAGLEVYVRDSFDRLFWHFEWIQSQIEAGLIRLPHVRFPFAYLTAHMDKNRPTFEAFLTEYDYGGTLKLMAALREEGLPPVTHDYRRRFARPRGEGAGEALPGPAPAKAKAKAKAKVKAKASAKAPKAAASGKRR